MIYSYSQDIKDTDVYGPVLPPIPPNLKLVGFRPPKKGEWFIYPEGWGSPVKASVDYPLTIPRYILEPKPVPTKGELMRAAWYTKGVGVPHQSWQELLPSRKAYWEEVASIYDEEVKKHY